MYLLKKINLKINNFRKNFLKKYYFQAFLFIIGILNSKIFFWGPLISFYDVDNLFLRELLIFLFFFIPVIIWGIFIQNLSKKIIFIFFILLFIFYFFIKILKFLTEKKIIFNTTFFIRYFQYYSTYFFFNKIILFQYFPLITFGNFKNLIFKSNFPWTYTFFITLIFKKLLEKNLFLLFLFLISTFLIFNKKKIKIKNKNFNFPKNFNSIKFELFKFIKEKKEKNFIFPETSILIDYYNEILEIKDFAMKEKKNLYIGILIKIFNEKSSKYENKNYLLFISENGNIFFREKINKIPFIEKDFDLNFNNFFEKNLVLNKNIYICSEVLLSPILFLNKKKEIVLLASDRWSKNIIIKYYFELIICYKNLIEKINSCSIKSAFSEINFN